MGAFNVEGKWVAHQSNGFDVTFRLNRNHVNLIDGSASFQKSGNTTRSNKLSGRVDDRGIVMTVNWTDGTVGEYNGTFGVDGRLTGHAFDVRNPGSQATWFTDQPFVAVNF